MTKIHRRINWLDAVNRKYLIWSARKRLAGFTGDMRTEDRRLECIGIARWLNASLDDDLTTKQLYDELDRLFDLAMRRVDEIDAEATPLVSPEVPPAAEDDQKDA